jgi:ABC-2 type transport system permease protein
VRGQKQLTTHVDPHPLLVVVPEILRLLDARFSAPVVDTIAQFTPAPAGARLLAGEWEYGLVLVAWAAAAITAGTWALRTRDA